MSYDFDDITDHGAPIVSNYVPLPHDLEAIVVLLQLGAIELTPSPGMKFSFQQLLAAAREYTDDSFVLEEADALIVVNASSFLKKEKGKLFSLK